MKNVYLDLFTDKDSILHAYEAPADALKGAVVYLAWYKYEDYSGSSLVIFKQNGKLYEVNGGHCSCNGLEGQWEPEETSWKALGMRDLYYAPEATAALQKLVKTHLKGKKS
jgi:hypothetical protein